MRSVVVLLTLLLSASFFSLSAQNDFYSRSWQRIYKFEQKVLPKSALQTVDSIYVKAKADGNVQEITKALIYQSKFALILQEDAELEVVKRWKKEISTAQAPLRNILESMLADMYWNYFQNDRYTFYNRTAVNDASKGTDFRTWDARALLNEIHFHSQNSLRNAGDLQKIKLESLSGILTEAEYSQLYRPYLYDLLIHNAIEFYSADEAEYGKRATRLSLRPNAYETFDPKSIPSDSTDRRLFTLILYHQALAFHTSRSDTSAIVNLELNRLKWVHEESSLPTKQMLYENALRNLKNRYQKHAASALIAFDLAEYLNGESSSDKTKNSTSLLAKREAVMLCRQTIATFPESHGARQCKSLLDNILAQYVRLKTEAYVRIQAPARISLEYANLDSITFSVFPVSSFFEQNFIRLKEDSARLAALSTLKAATGWASKLINPEDYNKHTTEVVLPPLSAGKYMIVGTIYNPARKSSDQTFSYGFIQVTDLVLLERNFDRQNKFQVVHRMTSRPIAGAIVTHTRTSADSSSRLITDKNGCVTLPSATDSYYTNITVQHGDDYAVFDDYYMSRYYAREEHDQETEAKTFMFTDRSIYRPGQTVFFKGILIKTKNRKSVVVIGEYVEVYLEDANGDEASVLRLKTNSFGSFSGEFKLPASGLTGEYSIYADEDSEDENEFYEKLDEFDYQRTEFSVEEYKRPTFEVAFKPVTKTFSIGDTIMLKGSATAFNGASLSNARIHYTITRTTRITDWRYRSYGNTTVTLVSSDTVAGSDGSFTIPIVALADESEQKEKLPFFVYEIQADVTDISGETRSAETHVNVGYHTLSVYLDAPNTVDRNVSQQTLTVNTKNLNEQHVPAKGKIKVYKLTSPTIPQRPSPWEAADLPVLTETEFKTLFPNDDYRNQVSEENAAPEKLIVEIPFNTAQTSTLTLTPNKKWQLGRYIIEVTAFDSSGYEIQSRHSFKVIDLAAKEIPENEVLFVQTDKESYLVGETVKLTIGSASADITVMLDIEYENGFIKSTLERFSNTSRTLMFPITEEMKNGFSITASAVNYNHFFYTRKNLPVTGTLNRLTLETLTFKDKLQPNSPYTWSFEVKGIPPNKDAEVLASMYDASLDQFKSHYWQFDPHDERRFRSNSNVRGDKSFSIESFALRNRLELPSIMRYRYYDNFDWFGFGITRSKYLQDSYLSRLYSITSTPEKPSRISMTNDRGLKHGIVSGVVVDPAGQPLAGVTVTLAGTDRAVMTDALGYYELAATKGDTLRFTYIGMNTAKAKVGKKNTVNVFLEEDLLQLSELVITASGLTVQRRELGNQATTVKSTVLEYSVNTMTGLSGKVPGLTITAITSGVDPSYRVVLRGQRSLSGNNRALLILDGVIVPGSIIGNLIASDISSIEVLNGSAAEALYGSDASNGALIINTISGQRKLDQALSKISVRKNFNETAFFFPHLITNELGRIRFTFTTPESLTRWKMQLLAHTDNLLIGESTLQAVTQKELMISPNVPRFLREGDAITLSAKITNLDDKRKEGFAVLQLFDAITGNPIDKSFGNQANNKQFKVAARQNTEVSWKLVIPAGIEAVQYKVIAKSGSFSDGEQNILPVLSNRAMVTEALPMIVRSGQSKTFTLDKLASSGTSPGMKHQNLTLEITANPAWNAIRSLPYLIEYPHECAEQLFSRYYANALASHIVNSNPKIKRVFDKWSTSGALISNLEKNPELKSILIEETPWLRDAQNEAEQQKRIALLFDLNTMTAQLNSIVTKLSDLQFESGAFPWFSGGRPNEYITRHIVSSFGHLRKLGVKEDSKMLKLITKSIAWLDHLAVRDYEYATTNNSLHMTNDIIHYLYMRSFYPEVHVPAATQKAIDYYIHQGTTEYWRTLDLYTKGMMALVQFRYKNIVFARNILKSLHENSITSEELGMYWKENQSGWYWYQSPVETQALLIEAFAEIESADPTVSQEVKQKTLDELRMWLLRNKQTSQWRTTRATSEAVYALLNYGTDWITIDQQPDIQIGGKQLVQDTTQAEAGTGYFKTSWKPEFITPSMATVSINNTSKNVTWGALYWQYSEQLDKITSAETALKLSKKVFKVIHGTSGQSLTEVNAGVTPQPGDLIRIRIELRSDRDMEFIHMKDMRAAGLEPVDVLSQYKWQEGLGYYQSTKDASTNFFFDVIRKGVYVFEYDLRVNSRGDFSNGITTLQCMYAPEFSSHSEGSRISVK